tara:strand:- start:1027 stop:1659 length:633 start_codon:yes stop_codon:yes gene_type:complete
MNKLEFKKFKSIGVNVVDPSSTHIDSTVIFEGNDIIVSPNTHIKGKTEIKSNCNIGPNSYLIDSSISENTNINFSYIEDSVIEAECKIGPFARIRNNSLIKKNVIVGNFAEIKNSIIGNNSKINHYCYIGDTKLGSSVNIGAGVVTCNFDGEKKLTTEIGDNSFIGSGTMLIAPVKIGKNSKTGAGSVITKDVIDFVTVVGNPAKILDNS